MPVDIAVSPIVQQAFFLLEMKGIASFGDDSDEAEAARTFYPMALSTVLEANDWSFASKMIAAAALADTAEAALDPRLPYLFELPDDCLVLREVLPVMAYRTDLRMLRTDTEGPITLRYTARIANETLLPGTFQAAAALQLAVLLSPRYQEVLSKQDRLRDNLANALARAGRTDAFTASPASYGGNSGTSGDWLTGALV